MVKGYLNDGPAFLESKAPGNLARHPSQRHRRTPRQAVLPFGKSLGLYEVQDAKA
jgi:hypothetical protein